ncbi:aminotransferase class I/II-fold pyridoxal phosphate-dependent enzyme [Pseudomaricurvus alkylphenolicus]|uniref:aminotransferase class I/II-fold pyridoxal phosphate-dependent enzyme n=1 Tax=Pseudomaricurvus alkylphenolicus TaxID=1306991 RepID=UPI001422E83A|nr:aminotransferase class I/II-fold pyridoxal phosphate-dependent enzyme [Pseudomaricurvus alkylphenolicus]NIB42484.1 aminotransferase class I/II-fold pyridoxal phosphate-dependent enzyme [Pseudomaricurvus alkylphenolicus]
MKTEPLQRIGATHVLFQGRKLSYFAGGDYHGYNADPRLKALARDTIDKFGLSASASRSTTGNHPLYGELEFELCRFMDVESATLCGQGYAANLIFAQALQQEFDHLLVDERCHVSLRDAARLIKLPVSMYRHYDMTHLEELLKTRQGRSLIVSDSVGGMLGDMAPLTELVELALQYDARALIDESHGLGVLGSAGRGGAEAAGIDSQLCNNGTVMRTSSLGKAIGAHGGVILGGDALAEQLQKVPMLFGTATPPLPYVAVAKEVLRGLGADPSPVRRLQERAYTVKKLVSDMGFAVEVNAMPVFALSFEPRQQALAREQLLAHDIYPAAINYPGLPDRGVFKFMLSSAHSESQIEALLKALAIVSAQL